MYETPIITKGFSNFASQKERCPSGLRSTLGKRVYGNVSGVRIPSSLQNINSNPSRDTGWVFNLVTRAETCFELEVNELKTRGREAPDGLLFYFHNSKDAGAKRRPSQKYCKKDFLDADEQSEVGHPCLKKL